MYIPIVIIVHTMMTRKEAEFLLFFLLRGYTR